MGSLSTTSEEGFGDSPFSFNDDGGSRTATADLEEGGRGSHHR